MKIRVDFTIDVPAEFMQTLIELSGTTGDATGAREFVQAEAEENILSYLEDNGVMARSVRGRARPGDHAEGDS